MLIKSFDPRENHILKELPQAELEALIPHLGIDIAFPGRGSVRN